LSGGAVVCDLTTVDFAAAFESPPPPLVDAPIDEESAKAIGEDTPERSDDATDAICRRSSSSLPLVFRPALRMASSSSSRGVSFGGSRSRNFGFDDEDDAAAAVFVDGGSWRSAATSGGGGGGTEEAADEPVVVVRLPFDGELESVVFELAHDDGDAVEDDGEVTDADGEVSVFVVENEPETAVSDGDSADFVADVAPPADLMADMSCS
jgi:hypothetical protein